ncbi:MAG: pyridoxamine 5'-phosphate oxidase family protein [Candidatus Omnitrophica bacterium]|nr:pyridoxamine 5'-phosphate oxidase family protein [Candidatus Omnitrophota bacterium]
MSKITDKVRILLDQRKFVSVGTATPDGQPNSVPKLFFRTREDFIWLIDHVMGRTVANLKANPRISISFMDQDSLEGYRLNGTAKVIESGKNHALLLKQWSEKTVKLSADRVIEGLRTGKRHEHYEVELPEKCVILKVKVEQVVKIGRHGDILNESV